MRREHRDLQELTKKGLVTLRSEADKQGKALAQIVKEEISARTLNVEAVSNKLEELRMQEESDVEGVSNEVMAVQSQLQSQIELVENSVATLQEELDTHQTTTEEVLNEVRAEMNAAMEESAKGVAEQLRAMEDQAAQAEAAMIERLEAEEERRKDDVATLSEAMQQLEGSIERALKGLADELVGRLRGEVSKVTEAAADAEMAMEDRRQRGEEDCKEQVEQVRLEWEEGIAESREQTSTALEQTAEGLREEVQELMGSVHKELMGNLSDLSQVVEQHATVLDDHARKAEELAEKTEGDVQQVFHDVGAVLEQEVGTLREADQSIEAQVSQLGDETAQKLVGFREYIDDQIEGEQKNRNAQLEESIAQAHSDAEQQVGISRDEWGSAIAEDRERSAQLENVVEQHAGVLETVKENIELNSDKVNSGLGEAREQSKAIEVAVAELNGGLATVRKVASKAEETSQRERNTFHKALDEVMENASSTNDAIEENFATMGESIQHLMSAGEAGDAHIVAAEEDIARMKEQIAANQEGAESRLGEAEGGLQEESAARIATDARVADVEAAYNTLHEEAGERTVSVDGKLALLESGLDTTTENHETVGNRLEASETYIKELQQKTAGLEEAHAAFESQSTAALSKLRQVSTKLQERAGALQNRVTAAEGELIAAQSGGAAQAGALSELGEQLRAEIGAAQGELKRVEEERSAADQLTSGALDEAKAGLAAQAEAAEARLALLETALGKLQESGGSAQESTDKLLAELGVSLGEAKGEVDLAKVAIEALQSSGTESKASLEAAVADVGEMKGAFEGGMAEMSEKSGAAASELSAALEAARAQIDAIEADGASVAADAEKAGELPMNSSVGKAVGAVGAEIAKLASGISTEKTHVANVEESVTELEAQLQSLKKFVDDAAPTTESKITRVEKLVALEVKKLRDELKEHEEKIKREMGDSKLQPRREMTKPEAAPPAST